MIPTHAEIKAFYDAQPRGLPGSWQRPVNWNGLRLWADTNGLLRVKTSAPASVSDGAPFFTNAVERMKYGIFYGFDAYGQAADGTTITVSGTGAAVFSGTAIAGRPGVTSVTTGTTTTGRAAQLSHPAAFILGQGPCTFETSAHLEGISDGTNTFEAWIGIHNGNSAAPSEAAVFKHKSTGGNWFAQTVASSVVTETDTGVPAVAGTYMKMRVEVNAAASSVAFYLNDVLVATHTATIPTAATGFGFLILKSAGTTARMIRYDWVKLDYPYTTPRTLI